MSYRGNSYRGRGRGGGFHARNDGFQIENGMPGTPRNVMGPGPQLNELASRTVQQNSVVVEIRNWQGASKDDLVGFLSRKTRIALMDSKIEGDVVKGLVRSMSEAESLKKWSGVRFAGNALRIEIQNANTQNTIELLKGFLHRRYNAELRLLDLTSIASDQQLISTGSFNAVSTQSKLFQALMKLASQEKFDVSSVNLSSNNLDDLSGISSLSLAFPNLQNLAISNNKISRLKSLEVWKNKFKFLRELILTNNPVTTNPRYKDEISKIFPRLVILDGIIIRDESKLQLIYKLPIPKKQFFFEDQEIQSMSTQFITNFLKFWDEDRSQLLPLYSSESQFSLSVDSSVPNDSDASQISFGFYIPISRNLLRVSSERTRSQRLGRGVEQIDKLFKTIPKTRHKLESNPGLYSMEAWRFPQLTGFLISLHGEFDEIAPPITDANGASNSNRGHRRNAGLSSSSNKLTPKSFDRTLAIVPGPNGQFIIASDLLSIRPRANADSWKEEQLHQLPQQQQQQQQPVTEPNVQLASNLPGPQQEILSRLSAEQQAILSKLLLETKLNVQFGLLLAEQSGWNFEMAIRGFTESHANGQIPPEAFQ